MFYQYRQAKSGGMWDRNDMVDEFVVVEAFSTDDANERACAVAGLYWDGSCGENPRDCACCGDRWARFGEWDEEPDLVPSVYGTPVDGLAPATERTRKHNVHVYWLNGEHSVGTTNEG